MIKSFAKFERKRWGEEWEENPKLVFYVNPMVYRKKG